MEDFVYFGGECELKHLGGNLYLVEGPAVLFGDGIKDADFVDDVFGDTKSTNYFLNPDGTTTAPMLFNHGVDPLIQFNTLGIENKQAMITARESDLWVQHHLDIAKQYDALVVKLLKSREQHGRKFGFSTGPVRHLVKKVRQDDGSNKITSWAIGEVSITLAPQDWRHVEGGMTRIESINVKSLLGETEDDSSTVMNSDAVEPEAQAEESKDSPSAVTSDADNKNSMSEIEVIGEVGMSENENAQQPAPQEIATLKAQVEAQGQQIDTMSKGINQMLEIMQQPRVNHNNNLPGGAMISETGGNSDPNVKSAGDLLVAIARRDNARLKSVYAWKAQTESSGPAGGYLIEEQTLMNLMPDIKLTSELGQLVTRVPVTKPAGKMPFLDLTRATAAGDTAEAGGLSSQGRAEGGAYGNESLYLEMMQFVVNDAASGNVVASMELIEDAPTIESLIKIAIENELQSKEERFILQGSGNGQPLGVLNWAGTIGIAEDTDNTFAIEDFDEMEDRFLISNLARTALVHHQGVSSQIRTWGRGSNGEIYVDNVMVQATQGYRRIRSQHLPQIGTDGYAVLGDWSRYLLFELGGIYIRFSEHADFTNGNGTWVFGRRQDGKPSFPNKVTLADGSFTVSPFVAINNLS